MDTHALLRPHKNSVAVDMAGEGDALFLNLTQLCKGKNLETTAIGQDRTLPAGESMEASQILHQSIPWTHMEMISVA